VVPLDICELVVELLVVVKKEWCDVEVVDKTLALEGCPGFGGVRGGLGEKP
jgi:hypothetical protein